MIKLFLLLIICEIYLSVEGLQTTNYDVYLDSKLCEQQLDFIKANKSLAFKFLDSGLRIPKGVLEGNFVDLGNYFQCLSINEIGNSSNIEGKFCTVIISLQDFQFIQPLSPTKVIQDITEFKQDPNELKINNETLKIYELYKNIDRAVKLLNGHEYFRQSKEDFSPDLTLAICLPKVCTTKEWINGFLNTTTISYTFTEGSCRLNNDKPWVPADYFAIVVFSILGILTLLSTFYDVWQMFIKKSVPGSPKRINPMYRSFSLYTNARRLTTYSKTSGSLECIDGIRVISLLWVIVGHTFVTLPPRVNVLESVQWVLSIDSTWITSALISVDTFFMLSGLLLVYTTANKFSGKKLLKNLHLFYLNRLMRMFPLLAAMVLIQASFLYRLSDGPSFESAITQTNTCRSYWWTTLLYIQNFLNFNNMCLPHTWYLAVDTQLHILSPLILYWVLNSNKTAAWIALASGLICVLTASTVYIFIKEIPGSLFSVSRFAEIEYYAKYYYFNTLTRASPFLVGMLFGYILHLYRETEIILSKFLVILLWFFALIITTLVIFSNHPMKNFEWDNQIYDSLVNSFSRTVWAFAIGWIIFACVHGYGGPINWFLSLHTWKLPSRLSYAMYLFHFSMMIVQSSAAEAPIYFSTGRVIYRFLGQLSLTFIISFLMTLFIDSPFSTIFKIVLFGDPKTSNHGVKIANGNTEDVKENDSPKLA